MTIIRKKRNGIPPYGMIIAEVEILIVIFYFFELSLGVMAERFGCTKHKYIVENLKIYGEDF